MISFRCFVRIWVSWTRKPFFSTRYISQWNLETAFCHDTSLMLQAPGFPFALKKGVYTLLTSKSRCNHNPKARFQRSHSHLKSCFSRYRSTTQAKTCACQCNTLHIFRCTDMWPHVRKIVIGPSIIIQPIRIDVSWFVGIPHDVTCRKSRNTPK